MTTILVKVDLATVVSVGIAILFGIVAAVQFHRANKFSKQVATAQGTFAKPDIRVLLYQKEIEQLVIAAALTKGRMLELDLPFSIVNTSRVKSAREIEILVRLPRLLADIRVGPSNTPKISAQAVNKTKNMQTLLISCTTIHPQQQYDFPLPLNLTHETVRPLKIPNAKTKDGVVFDAECTIEFEYCIDVTILQLDQPAATARFGVTVVDISNKSVEDFFASTNRRNQLKPIAEAKWVKPFQLVEYTEENLTHDPKGPVDRVKKGTVFAACYGVETDTGYIYPPRKKKSQ